MSISSTSRYSQGTVVRMPDANGIYNLTVLRTTPPAQATYALYIWADGDRPDLVAAKTLGDSSLWWEIFDVNPELIYPLNIPAGAAVRIPSGSVVSLGTLIQ